MGVVGDSGKNPLDFYDRSLVIHVTSDQLSIINQLK